MTPCPWARLAMLPLALALSSCSLQRVNESANRAEQDAEAAGRYARYLRNQQPEPHRDTVVFSDKPWVSTEPLAAKRGLPVMLDRDIAYRPAAAVSISELAQYITRETGLPVVVAPDAINPNLLASTGTGSVQGNATAPAPDSLAGLMPASVLGGSPSATRNFDMGSLAGSGLIGGIKYAGPVSGLLNQVTSRLGLAWHFDPELRGVRITYFDTRTFDIWAFGDDQTIESTVKSGLITSTGTGSGESGSTSSNSGASGESGSNQSTTVTIKTSLLGDIENNLKAMLSTQPPGRMFLSRSTGTLTVTDRPEVLSRIATYLDSTNRSITKQVLFNVKVFEVALSDQDQMGLNWSAVYRSLSNKWGVSLSNTASGIASDAVSGSVSILDTSNSPWAGSNFVMRALAEQGRISNVRSPSVTTLNLQPAPIQIGNVQSYVASSSTTNTADVGSSTSLTPATISSGFNMMLLPRVIDQDNLLLMISLSMSSRPTFQTFTSNGSSVQTTDYDTKNTSPKVKLRSGQTLVLTGFEENSENATKRGVGSPGFLGLGGSRIRSSGHSVLVVLITPVVLPDELAYGGSR
ncbi:PilN family type IVB pilus formation outer membrane protein [Azotobacter vinelandii]|uniref:PilN family type IVB pilus formation outer membrane protein n=1 Tax=Azotobacter vinelandii TaxID=354 RepID=UPI0009170558|nr:PilN family type IVB pilus formation outer membrane protein [Azotobacter vinelandii]WKN23192.1 PilN family type IVB pilus formation outer membrane protein [Azotobacter vinelandii]SFY09025.1 type IVB pilus formation outer membrane protein, R64 PilN family [Azotobacter vinelandii]